METIINIVFYIATGLAALTIICVWLSEVRLSTRRFKWYFYIPHSLINTVLGVLAPTVLFNGLLNIIFGEAAALQVIFMLLWAAALFVNNLCFFFKFRDRDDFSAALYWCSGLTGLFILSFWILKLLPV